MTFAALLPSVPDPAENSSYFKRYLAVSFRHRPPHRIQDSHSSFGSIDSLIKLGGYAPQHTPPWLSKGTSESEDGISLPFAYC